MKYKDEIRYLCVSEDYFAQVRKEKRNRNIKAYVGMALCFVMLVVVFLLVATSGSNDPSTQTMMALLGSAPFLGTGLYLSSKLS